MTEHGEDLRIYLNEKINLLVDPLFSYTPFGYDDEIKKIGSVMTRQFKKLRQEKSAFFFKV